MARTNMSHIFFKLSAITLLFRCYYLLIWHYAQANANATHWKQQNSIFYY